MNKIILKLPLFFSFSWLILFFIFPFIIIFAVALSLPIEAIPPFEPFIRYAKEIGIIINPTLENFSLLFTDKAYLNAYLLSLRLAVETTIITLILGYPIALYIASKKEKTRKTLLMLILIPFFTSLLIRIYAWMILLKKTGLINKTLLKIGLISKPIIFLNNEYAVLIGMVYSYLPFMILPIYSVIEKISPEIVEASHDLGARNFTTLFKIVIPMSVKGIISGSLLVFIPAVGEFVIPELLGGSEVMTIGKLIWTEFFIIRNWPVAASMAVSLSILLILPIFILRKLDKEER
ncbi:MAG: ABC transporter permease [Sphingobacteriia bacterium]|nr:ABC transporter permease [Sphingobacteriia bacterium]